ncbi:class I SAM-dependent methyltransferase [Fictibacillus sp. 18YEL24]|uniref:class I SAM-dependent methyltransferase n=1 Tax=Fictibacillus sp. 18YEL24 TaxID=2745875 RepID=UPI0018CC86E9|nr:class I SAM-dependent methyltransferase [Fictibacillus sp. 18YEL24]MBH0169949.1 class I SAM-dependent methyltransferase [Fictibacillus sp. 18YEL24]
MDLLLKESLKASYNEQADSRNRVEIESWKVKELDLFIAALKNDGYQSLLDIGAGSGQHGKYLSDHKLDVTCIDLSPNMVETCRTKGLKAEIMDYYTLDFQAASFDAVWAMNTLLHVPKVSLPAVLKNIHTVLAQDGLFYMGVYGGKDSEGVWQEDSYIPKRFFSFYTDENLLEVVSPLFDVINFHTVPEAGGSMDFQSLMMRKKAIVD